LGKGKVDESEGKFDVFREPGGSPTASRVDWPINTLQPGCTGHRVPPFSRISGKYTEIVRESKQRLAPFLPDAGYDD
jgi:hypothetical protein